MTASSTSSLSAKRRYGESRPDASVVDDVADQIGLRLPARPSEQLLVADRVDGRVRLACDLVRERQSTCLDASEAALAGDLDRRLDRRRQLVAACVPLNGQPAARGNVPAARVDGLLCGGATLFLLGAITAERDHRSAHDAE